jgi:hypothetical protein
VLEPNVPLDTTPADLRELCYREVGLFVSGRCHILLALWDGIRNESFAGTAEVVRFKLEGRSHPATRGLDIDYDGPVYWVHARRAGSPGTPEAPGKWIYPQEANAELQFRGGAGARLDGSRRVGRFAHSGPCGPACRRPCHRRHLRLR